VSQGIVDTLGATDSDYPRGMPKLTARERARLPDGAFAYIDGRGRRRLPIHDEVHVRNALARFNRVSFENDAARDGARKRLLNAAKKYGIVPVGFIDGQLQSERLHAKTRARSTEAATLPTGFVTFLLTDIEGSTALLRQLGERYADLLHEVRGIIRQSVLESGGREIDARADEFFAVFERAEGSIEAALTIQRTLSARSWPGDLDVRLRAGIHSGRASLSENGYVGLSVHTAARVCSAGHGGQIVVSGGARSAVEQSLPADVRLHSLGRHHLRGLVKAEQLFQVEAEGLLADFPPLRTWTSPPPSHG
jgi:class 3 adenylate cyclase